MSGDNSYDYGLDESCLDPNGEVKAGRHAHHADGADECQTSKLDIPAIRKRYEAATVAQAFHEAYEELAPRFGYKTREASAVPWADVPVDNQALMIATAKRVMQSLDLPAVVEALEEAQARLRKANCDYGDGWLSDDLECGIDAEPWCGKHAVLYYIKASKEAQGKLDAVDVWLAEPMTEFLLGTRESPGIVLAGLLAILYPQEGE